MTRDEELGKIIRAAELLLLRMTELGISRYEPDPIGALERIERASVT